MIRFKVIKASRLLLALAIAVLVLVAGFIALQTANTEKPPSRQASVTLAAKEDRNEAETEAVFASASVWADAGSLPLDPGRGIEVEIVSPLPSAPSPTARPSARPTAEPARRPSVFIYHTHTHEAYEQVQDDPYDAVEAWRTTDESHSVVRVGEELARCLEASGFDVTHDQTDHEGDALSTAYERSIKTLEAQDQRYDLYIDLHRDAWVNGMEANYTDVNGRTYARPMLLIGNGAGFNIKPFYKQNRAFAEALTERINRICPGLCKPVLVKDGRYNQHIGIFSVLIEVGHNRNTLREALNTVPILAEAMKSLMIDDTDPELESMRLNEG